MLKKRDVKLDRLRRERESTIEAYTDQRIETVEEFRAKLDDIEQRRRSVLAERADERRRAKLTRRSWPGVGNTTKIVFGDGRARRHPSAEAIVAAQRSVWRNKLKNKAAALSQCWACLRLAPTGELEKAHIHPVRFGGPDAPWNFFLLCWACHGEQNDGSSRREQLRWLREHKPFDQHWTRRIAEMGKGTQ